jgi:hypothetical protein
MRVVWAICSDYFIKDAQTGKDSIVGIFTHINVPELPSPPISMWLTVQVEFELDDTEEPMHMRCDLIDEDGQVVHYVDVTVSPPPGAVVIGPVRPVLPMFLPNVVFSAPGMHQMNFKIGDTTIYEMPLMVTTMPQQHHA